MTHGNLLPVLPGERFGRGRVIREIDRKYVSERRPRGVRAFELLCDCGTTYEATLSSLRESSTVSCGCYHLEQVAALGRITGGYKGRKKGGEKSTRSISSSRSS